ncbi:MAG TPA: glycosyltransferase 87 family protein [Gaiellaceae bacterium]
MSIRARVGITVGCIAVFLGSWALVHHSWYASGGRGVDITIYQGYALETVHGQVPYRDFSLEYPPGFLLPALAPTATAPADDFGAYVRGFDRWMAGAGVALLVFAAFGLTALRAERKQFALALGFIALSPLLVGLLMFSRFDLWPTALAVGGLSALLAGRDRTGGALLGAAIAAKLWPVVLVPLALVWVWRRHGRAATVKWSAIVVGTCAAFFVPFAVLAPGGLGHSFGLQIDRPLQLESLGSTVLLAAHSLGGLGVTEASTYGSANIVAHGATAMADASAVAQLLALCAIWVAFARGPARGDRLAIASAACVAVFIAFGKVFSPQYLIWLIPFVALARRRLASLLLAAALVATQFYWPSHYDELLSFKPFATGIVLTRDLVVVAIAVELGRALLEREPAEDAEPAPQRAALTPDPLPG